MFDCCIFDEDLICLKSGTKYKVVEKGTICGIVFGLNNEIPFVLDLNNATNGTIGTLKKLKKFCK